MNNLYIEERLTFIFVMFAAFFMFASCDENVEYTLVWNPKMLMRSDGA